MFPSLKALPLPAWTNYAPEDMNKPFQRRFSSANYALSLSKDLKGEIKRMGEDMNGDVYVIYRGDEILSTDGKFYNAKESRL